MESLEAGASTSFSLSYGSQPGEESFIIALKVFYFPNKNTVNVAALSYILQSHLQKVCMPISVCMEVDVLKRSYFKRTTDQHWPFLAANTLGYYQQIC